MTDALLDAARGLSSATAHEAAGKIGALPSAIKPIAPGLRICGRAFPVQSPPGDNLSLHHAIYAASPGDILVVRCADALEFGYWGEVMSVAAQAVGLGGLVIHGGIRDSVRLAELGFPVFAANVAIRGTGKDPLAEGSVGEPVAFGSVTVHRGDIVIGDADGVMVLPADDAASIIAEGRKRDASEEDYFRRLRGGETTLAIYGLPDIGARG